MTNLGKVWTDGGKTSRDLSISTPPNDKNIELRDTPSLRA